MTIRVQNMMNRLYLMMGMSEILLFLEVVLFAVLILTVKKKDD